MKTPMKVSIKVQMIVRTPYRMRYRMSITFKCIFREKIISDFFFFLQRDNIIFVTFIHIYKIYMSYISYFYVFFEKDHLSFSVQRKNILFFGKKKILSFQIIPESSYSSAIFLKRPSFRGI